MAHKNPFVGAHVFLNAKAHKHVALGSKPDGGIYTHENHKEWEQWHIEDAGNGKVLVRSIAHKKQLGAKPDGSVYMHENRLAWEQWRIHWDGKEGGFHLESEHKTHLGSRPDHTVYTHANKLAWRRGRFRSWACLRITK